VLLRILSYAEPFRHKIAGAVLIGLVAGMLGAFNIIALVPALQIIIEPGERERRIEKLERDLKRLATSEPDSGWAIGRAFQHVHRNWEAYRKEQELAFTRFMVEKRENAVYMVVGFVISAQILKAFLDFASKYQLQKYFIRAANSLRTQLYRRTLALDIAHFQQGTTGDLMGRLNNDIREVRSVFGSVIGTGIVKPFEILCLVVVLLVLSPALTLVTFVAVPVIVVPMALLGRKLRAMGKRDEEEDVRILDTISETLQQLSFVKAANSTDFEADRFEDQTRGITQRQIRREFLRMLNEPVVEMLSTIAMGAAILLGTYFILDSDRNEMEASHFIAYLIALSRFYQPMKAMTKNFVRIQKGLASGERVFEIIDRTPQIVSKPGAPRAAPLRSGIEFRGIGFRYAENRPWALRGIELVVPRGKRIALVGETGSGKSTLARLLLRLFDPQEGSILWDGTDIRELDLESLREHIAYVSQDVAVFNDSILYNIRYSRTEATFDEVVAAAKAANIHEFIESLRLGYHTPVGERGGQLSGGQRQRIAIARAILRNAPVLVLDEATSALDNESEALVKEALDRLMEGRTTIVIAHRLSTVRNADEIIVMDDGRIIERGTHEQLHAMGGRYYRLCRLGDLGGPRTDSGVSTDQLGSAYREAAAAPS
jgi:ABC-type multidrug transport system fused ATPase/permease subunit